MFLNTVKIQLFHFAFTHCTHFALLSLLALPHMVPSAIQNGFSPHALISTPYPSLMLIYGLPLAYLLCTCIKLD